MQHIPRLFIPHSLGEGALVRLSETQAHHMVHVLRKKVGDPVMLFNAKEGEWLGEFSACHKKDATVLLKKMTRLPKPEPEFCLVFAPLKHDALTNMLEKATELGIASFWPVNTDHTIVTRVALEKWEMIVQQSAEQSERCSIPSLHPFQPLQTLLLNWPANRLLFYADERGNGLPLPQALKTLPNGKDSGILIGPEGGFSQKEQTFLRTFPFVIPITLGPRILKADTAAITAISCVLAEWGDWHERPI